MNILDIFRYDSNNPLIFTSGRFFLIFILFYIIYSIISSKIKYLRTAYIVLFSLFFYYNTSGLFFLLLILMSISDYNIANWIISATDIKTKKRLLTLSILIDVGILGYFKYTNFFLDIISSLLNSPFKIESIFLPAGISFFVFQSISYVVDAYREGNAFAAKKYLDYLFYLSFFPHILAGPIVRAKQFMPQIENSSESITKEEYNQGFFLILVGLIKKAIISDYIAVNFIDRIFDSPEMYTGFENLIGIYGYTLQIYFDFSGYSDIAIGLALLVGYKLPINFDRPYLSSSPTEFWRRWHITLSLWLRDYLYIPLGGNRQGKFRTHLNLLITMLIGGLWHGASYRFILWGLWHGIGLSIHKLLMGIFPKLKVTNQDSKWTIHKIIGCIVTFHFVALGWILFKVTSLENGYIILDQVFTNFNLQYVSQICIAYWKIFLMILIGYLLIFMPAKIHKRISCLLTETSIPSKIIMLVIVFWTILQIQSGEIQSFIYFQF